MRNGLNSPSLLLLLIIIQIVYAAVDCTKGQNHELCKQEGVEGYPTFNYYNYGKFVEKYDGDRGVSAATNPTHFYFSPLTLAETQHISRITFLGRGGWIHIQIIQDDL